MCRPHLDRLVTRDIVARLWRRDHTLWNPDPAEISNRLGWLDLPFSMRDAAGQIDRFAAEARGEGFRDVLLLGMGGSSLSAEVLKQAFGLLPGAPRMHVLDTTVPDTVARVTDAIDAARSLYLVSSKSGGTVEVMSLYRHFRELTGRVKGDAGRNFVAITDVGTSLEKLADEERFRRTFINPSDIGGRFSVLSYFGLVPAALMGIEADTLLSRAREAVRACEVETPIEENPGAWLGFVMGCLALNGRNKLTILTSPKLAGFGLWAEQLIAESTGKDGLGVVPVAEEPFAPASAYGPDRFFVYLRLGGDDNAAADAHVRALDAAGIPVMAADLADLYDLAGAFFRWEFATAIAGACLKIHPFNQPNVEESKKNAKRILAEFEKTRAMPKLESVGDPAQLLAAAKPGDYVALMAFVDDTPGTRQALQELRRDLVLKRKLATTLGFGPRFLHSTGQIHKGGPAGGIFIQITAAAARDVPIPGAPYGFAALAAGQAIGDFESLQARGRACARIHVEAGASIAERIRGLLKA
jgi:glucose-6-phosphate isomerase/transaldolase/glucose-6-phosphate isomerase